MKIYGNHDDNTIEQAKDVASRAEKFALMADGHRGYVMPIGGVAAYKNLVSPIGIGVDISCGNAAVSTNLTVSDIGDNLKELADEIADTIGFGMGRPTNDSEDSPDNHPLFESSAWEVIPAKVRGNLKGRARSQLGTVGGGNHYVDVFKDENGKIWVGVHFGSRGFGFITAHGFVAMAQGESWTNLTPQKNANMNDEVLLSLDSQIGQDYWAAMELAGEYAYAGREWVVRKVCRILGGKELDIVHNHHNFAWREDHDGEELIVVRKGATPAFPGQRGFVGGSMGDMSVILEGTKVHTDTLNSTVHGAGRVMGRMQAKGKWKKGVCTRPGRISHEEMRDATQGVEVRGGDLDEAPQVYRKLGDVLDFHQENIRVIHTLQPLIVCMAPSRTVDPYKD